MLNFVLKLRREDSFPYICSARKIAIDKITTKMLPLLFCRKREEKRDRVTRRLDLTAVSITTSWISHFLLLKSLIANLWRNIRKAAVMMKICLPTTKVWRRASRVEMYYLMHRNFSQRKVPLLVHFLVFEHWTLHFFQLATNKNIYTMSKC